MRTNVEALTKDQPEPLKAQFRSAFDYLERLASTYKDDGFHVQTAPVPQGREVVPIDLVFKTLASMFREEAEAKRLDFRVEDTDLSVFGDPLIIMRILSNLVSNAIRHTDAGHIQICARTASDGVRIEVANSGETFSPDQLEHIFERGSKDHGSSGEGLGLAICRSLAEKSGIDFAYASDPRRGNVFSLGFQA